MQPPGFRPLNRGEISILAAFSLVVILAGVGLFLQTFTPVPASQTAATATAAPTTPQGIDQQCQKGYVNSIAVNKGSFTNIKDQSINCYQGRTADQINSNSPDPTYPQCEGLNSNQCQVIACPSADKEGDTCVEVGTCTYNADGTNDCSQMMSKMKTGSAASVLSVMQTYNGDVPGIADLLKGDVNGGSTISAAFGGAVTQAEGQLDTQIQQQTQAVTNAQDQLSKFAACGEVTPTDSGYAACQQQVTQAQNNLDAQKGQLDALQQQKTDLAAAQQTLTPPSAQGPCPNGSTVNSSGGCGGSTPTCPSGNCSGDQTKNNNNTFPTSALNSLLSGFARGLATPVAPTAPPAAPAAPAQACSTDPNTYSQQQQQYQTALQQYNYQQQQYQYQQQQAYNYGGTLPAAPVAPQACNPSTQSQCSLQPPQPAASSCTGGSWTPQMNGSCIVGWQCSNLGAQLSCQPQTADVGMSIAISYSCAQGIASGSGFNASGTSGTSTATVAAPPAGTNTATYALTCTQGQVTSGAQCSIQIASPTIILVANPATIHSGATSLIGWVTTGINACVISSPDDPTFTSQNSANTSANGTATTLPAANTQSYLLHCTTVSGGTKDATVSVALQ